MKDGRIIYFDGKVIANDYHEEEAIYKANPIEYEYQDNIEEIIKSENIIEELQKTKKEKKEKVPEIIDIIKYNKKVKKLIYSLIIACPLLFSGIGLLSGIDKMFMGLNFYQFLGICGALVGAAIYVPFLSLINKSDKYNKNALKYTKLQLDEIENELSNEKKHLNELKSNKTKKNQEKKEKERYVDISGIHLDKLNKIKHNLIMYREIIENEKEFKKLYNNDGLEEQLRYDYDEEDIKKIKTYFKK